MLNAGRSGYNNTHLEHFAGQNASWQLTNIHAHIKLSNHMVANCGIWVKPILQCIQYVCCIA